MFWEYRLVPVQPDTRVAFYETASVLGLDDWELISVTEGIAYFKRSLLRTEGADPEVCMNCTFYARKGEDKDAKIGYGFCHRNKWDCQDFSSCHKFERDEDIE